MFFFTYLVQIGQLYFESAPCIINEEKMDPKMKAFIDGVTLIL